MSDKNNKTTSKINILQKETLKVGFGLILVLFSFYMTLSLVSYFFTGGADQSLVEHLDLNASDEIKAQIQNWTGYRGAKMSEFFMAKTFGISSFAIAYFIARCGLKFMSFMSGKIFRLFVGCLFFTLWSSFFLSFIGAENSVFNFGGHCGKSADTWIEAQVGLPGAFLLLLFSLIVFLYCFKGITFIQIRDSFKAFFARVNKLGKKHPENQKEEDIKQPIEENIKKEEIKSSATSESTSPDEKNTDSVEQATKVEDESKEKDANENISDSLIGESDNNNSEIDKVAENHQESVKKLDTGEEVSDNVEFSINVPSDNSFTSTPDNTEDDSITENGAEDADSAYRELMEREGPYDPTKELEDYKMPTLDLLTDYPFSVSVDEEEQKENKDRIVQVLKNFGIEISSVSATVGPTITLFEIVPAPGVRISKIQSLEKDIALSLAAKGIRIIAPIPGKGTIGIEVPNKKPQTVSMKSVLASSTFQESKAELPVAFGRTITNDVFMVDLAKTPHLLVAGATGMGKSVGLNVLLTSLLYKKHPATMKLVMVDPKQVEFSIYEKIEKHFLAKLPGDASAIITDTTKVIQTLNSLTTEMENRYSLLADVHLRNIKEYNAKFISRRINPAKELPNGLMHHYLPYIVVIIDEYGDLLMTAGKEIESPITRIAQKARAVGIHMVIATQRPSVKIVTGTIKANFPARLAFRVASRIDSQTILDAPGAQELVGRGDMLYSTGGAENTRVQCAFVDTPEVENVNEFIGKQHGYPEAYRLPEYIDENGDVVGSASVDVKSLDPRLREAADLVVNAQNGSTSNVQRTLEVGFNRAGRIMDQLQAIGIVGPVCGSKPREVLVRDLLELDIIFKNLK